MKTHKFFDPSDRYHFDVVVCTAAEGWAQVDTAQDAPYFGNWANPFKLETISYAEGDVVINSCENTEEFVQEIRNAADWHMSRDYGFGIDPGNVDKIAQRFIELGLGNFIH